MRSWPNARSISFVNTSCFLPNILVIFIIFLGGEPLPTDESKLNEIVDDYTGEHHSKEKETKGQGILLKPGCILPLPTRQYNYVGFYLSVSGRNLKRGFPKF